jgi:hypothetical protein
MRMSQDAFEIETGYVVMFSIGCALLGYVIWLLLRRMDSHRVRNYIELQGGQLLSIKWAPFGPGCFGANKSRIYKVHYLDANAQAHEAFCKTSALAGVYFTEDRIVQYR